MVTYLFVDSGLNVKNVSEKSPKLVLILKHLRNEDIRSRKVEYYILPV